MTRARQMMEMTDRVCFDINLEDKDDFFLVELAKSIERNTSIRKLWFRYQRHSTVSVNGWKALFQVLQINKTIQQLSFNNCNLNFEWAQLFATMVLFNNNTITDLYIASDTDMNGVTAIVDALCEKPAGCTLTSLGFSGVMDDSSRLDNVVVRGAHLAKKFVTLPKVNQIKRIKCRCYFLYPSF
jgi:hypothetical protein